MWEGRAQNITGSGPATICIMTWNRFLLSSWRMLVIHPAENTSPAADAEDLQRKTAVYLSCRQERDITVTGIALPSWHMWRQFLYLRSVTWEHVLTARNREVSYNGRRI